MEEYKTILESKILTVLIIIFTIYVVWSWARYDESKGGQKHQKCNVEEEIYKEVRESYLPPLVLNVARDKWMLKQIQSFMLHLKYQNHRVNIWYRTT